MRTAYVGHEVLTFSDYIDLETGKTLHAEPGRSYDVAPASGRVVPEFPEPWFILAEPPAPGGAPDLWSPEAESGPEAILEDSPAPDDEHGTEEG